MFTMGCGALDLHAESKKQIILKEKNAVVLMLLAKLAERSPIKYNLARNAASLSPINIVKNEEEYGVRFCSLADKLHAVNNVKASVFVVLSCNMKSLQIISIFIVKMSF